MGVAKLHTAQQHKILSINARTPPSEQLQLGIFLSWLESFMQCENIELFLPAPSFFALPFPSRRSGWALISAEKKKREQWRVCIIQISRYIASSHAACVDEARDENENEIIFHAGNSMFPSYAIEFGSCVAIDERKKRENSQFLNQSKWIDFLVFHSCMLTLGTSSLGLHGEFAELFSSLYRSFTKASSQQYMFSLTLSANYIKHSLSFPTVKPRYWHVRQNKIFNS